MTGKIPISKSTAQILVGIAANVGMMHAGYRQREANIAWYNQQPEEVKRRVYNNCPLQKVGSGSDAFSAIIERQMTLDPSSHEHLPTQKPYGSP